MLLITDLMKIFLSYLLHYYTQSGPELGQGKAELYNLKEYYYRNIGQTLILIQELSVLHKICLEFDMQTFGIINRVLCTPVFLRSCNYQIKVHYMFIIIVSCNLLTILKYVR